MTNFGQSEQQRDTILNPSTRSIRHENHETANQTRDMWPSNTQAWKNNDSHESGTQLNHSLAQAWKNNGGYEANIQRSNRGQQPQTWNSNPATSRQNNWHNNTQGTWGQGTNNGDSQRNYNSNNQTNGNRPNERYYANNTNEGNTAGRANSLPNSNMLQQQGATRQPQNETFSNFVRSTREVITYNKW